MTDAPEVMYCAPHPKTRWAIALAGDWPSPGNPNDTKYIRADLLEAHIGAVLEEAAERALPLLTKYIAEDVLPCYDVDGELYSKDPESGGADKAFLEHALRLDALRPDAMQALERVRREARVETYREIAAHLAQSEMRSAAIAVYNWAALIAAEERGAGEP